ncbi:phage holin family protein [Paenibacillus sp. JCM 10914]|uniref:phage holin family protein n=1 Tax=Paenibacillus sp. JCM 10914 TaxID=1236974 RepID=UPI0003CCB9E2|nr:phage holin family protein [Paenibacillus sp. JCM 10914]GAE05262.1 holin [Paenibacillus sp. JCM 10914]
MYESTLYKLLFYTIGGSVITFLFGSWSQPLNVLATLVTLDYVTGLAASYYEGRKNVEDTSKGWNSNKGYWGIIKKILMFSVIALLFQIDKLLGLDGSLSLMTGAIFFYIGNELISLMENYGRLDLPMPPQMKNAITALKSKASDEGKG